MLLKDTVNVTNLVSKLFKYSSVFSTKKTYHNPQTMLGKQATLLLTIICIVFIVKKHSFEKIKWKYKMAETSLYFKSESTVRGDQFAQLKLYS